MTDAMNPTIDGSVRVVRNTQVAAHALGGTEGGVLLHLKSGQYHGVDTVGWTIWNLLDGSRTFDGLVQQLRIQYPDAPDGLSEDARRFIQGLLERDLVEVVAPGGEVQA